MDVGLHQNLPQFTVKVNYEAKLKELLRNLTSVESQVYVNSCKEFIRILKSDSGPDLVCAYVQTSFDLVELSQAWDFRKGKPGFSHLLNIVSAILKHSRDNGAVSSNNGVVSISVSHTLDKFARSIIADKMGDLYKELKSKDGKSKNSVLLLLTSIVRRSSYLSSEVAKVFDFKVPGFGKLAEVRLRKRKVGEDLKKGFSTRKAFVGFSMSFLEVGNSRFLKGILQQKEIYSGVLRGLGSDDEETVVFVLSILRDRVLVPESSVPPGLRSVLFGSVTLEQLVDVSGRSDFVDGAELAHNVLVMVCTNPLNGLMPNLERQLRGNVKRLLDLMKKLKATEVEYHKILLLAIVKGRPLFGAAYLDEFPYNIEDLASHNWFAAISLAADVVSSVNEGLSLTSVDRQSALDSQHVKNILRCVGPRSITRLVLNKGLLHSDSLVKHGTLKLVLEELKLLDSLVKTLDISSHPNNQSVLTEIENGVRVSLPDAQVLFSLLSPLSNHFKSFESTKKRKAEIESTSEHYMITCKKLRTSAASDDLDIVISGVNSSEINVLGNGEIADSGDEQHSEIDTDVMKSMRDLWGVRQCSGTNTDVEDADTYFYSKTLDALKFYYGAVPVSMDGLFDLFKFLPNNPLVLPTVLQQSLLQLLNKYLSQFYKDADSIRLPLQMFKHLHPFIVLLMFSPVKELKEQAYVLAKASMLSTGAFDHNTKEICAWFFFIPGYRINHIYTEDLEVEIFLELSSFIVSFLCDAVSTTGNNLYKYMELLKHYLNSSDGGKDASPETSPLVLCALEKCLRLLSSESGSFTLPQKSSISLYVCNTIKYILDTQVNARPLSFVIDQFLSEKFTSLSQKHDDAEFVEYSCEWKPLKNLLRFARDILQKNYYGSYSYVSEVVGSNSTFVDALTDIKGVVRSEQVFGLFGPTVGYSFSLLCTQPSELLQNFPLLLSISSKLLDIPFAVLGSIFFLEASYLDGIWKLWPEMVSGDLDSVFCCKDSDVKTASEVDADSTKAGSVEFLRFLRSAPFHEIFSAIIQSRSTHIMELTSLRKFLLVKLSEMPNDHLISSLCNILFWISQTYYCYMACSSGEYHLRSEMCFVLAERLLTRLLVDNVDTAYPPCVKDPLVQNCGVELADIIFNHPTILQALNYPLLSRTDCPESVWRETHEGFRELAKEGIHPMYHHILNLIRKAAELLFQRFSGDQAVDGRKRIRKAFNNLIRRFILIFKNDFDACMQSGDFKALVPKCYALYTMIQFVSPSELLELVTWLFFRIDYVNTTPHLLSKETALFLCLQMTSYTFDLLAEYMGQPLEGCKLITLLADAAETPFDVCLFERIFSKVVEITFHIRLDIAAACLLKAIKAVKGQKVIRRLDLPSIAVLSRAVANIPATIVPYCLNGITRTKAELLHHVSVMSPLHMSIFGCVLCSVLGEPLLSNVDWMRETQMLSLSDEDLVMLLPTVSSYICSISSKSRGFSNQSLHCITSTYGRVLFDGFSKWDKFVPGIIFNIKNDQPLHESAEEILNYFSDSLLGKAILMVQDHLVSSEDMNKLERRLSLFNCVCPCSDDDDFFDYCGEPGLHSLQYPLDFVNRVVAKIKFCRILLFPDRDNCQSQLDDGTERFNVSEVASEIEKSRIQFLRKLVCSWTLTVKKISGNNYDSKNVDSNVLFKFLDVFVMNNIVELTEEMHGSLVRLSSIPFIEQLVRSFLVHKFGDSATIKMLRTHLSSLSYGNFSCASVINLLLAHSQFTKSFQLGCRSLDSTQFGLLFTPMQSILKSYVIINSDSQSSDLMYDRTSQKHLSLLELVKLIRLLFSIYVRQRVVDSGEGDNEINFRELVYLLLSSYGATCTEVDVEIYNLILEIESSGKPTTGVLAEMDYLWGVASLKTRKDRERDKELQIFDPTNVESFEDYRRTKFRENITIDPKLCAQTVLYFPYHRYVTGGTLDKLQKDLVGVVHEAHSGTVEEMQIYDPVFILHFSIHCLSMNYIEPVEFAGLGLLAVTFICISSPDVDMRKLGYEALAKFKSAIERCIKTKDVARLRLLLSYLQNGIEEPWQRVPCITAVFIAEASLTLLDTSHDNYSTISKYLMKSHAVNMKAIPLFEKLFWSSSINHRAERLWVLRLLLVGLNMEDDTHIYIKDSIFQNLLSFYSSHLSDHDSKDLIIQIFNKAVQSHKSLWFLVKHCGLILWLSSMVSSLNGSQWPGQKSASFTHLPTILKIINHIILPRNIVEWLQENAMEQLSELSSHLYKFIVGGIGFIQDNSFLFNSILQILTVLLKISQKRKIYQPHFTLPVEGLFNLHEAVELCCSRTSCNTSMVSGLITVLMSTPPVTIFQMDLEKLSKLLRWAVTTAFSETRTIEESLASKLLRWLTASVILGKIYHNLNKFDPNTLSERPNLEKMCSLLVQHEKKSDENAVHDFDIVLASSILYLLQEIGFNHSLLPSAVSALCLLFHSRLSSESEISDVPGISLSSLCSKVHCPAEANPAWRWSYHQPWRDLSLELTPAEKLDEIHACERLLRLLVSNMLPNTSFLTLFDDADYLHVYDWEISLFI